MGTGKIVKGHGKVPICCEVCSHWKILTRGIWLLGSLQKGEEGGREISQVANAII